MKYRNNFMMTRNSLVYYFKPCLMKCHFNASLRRNSHGRRTNPLKPQIVFIPGDNKIMEP